MSKLRSPLALGAIFVIAVVALVLIFAVGKGVPGDSVAKVGDVAIKRATFDHWAGVASRQQGTPTASGGVPKPPDYKACIAAKRKTQPKPAKGQPTATDDQLKQQCAQEYGALRDSVVSLLVNGEWILGEAHDQGVRISDADVVKSFERQKGESFKQESEYQNFLKQTGYTTEDLLWRVKIADLTNKLRDKILKGKDKASDKELRSYYDKNKAQLGQPETRDVRVVLAQSTAKANEAKAALQAGQGWKAVAQKYSTDQSSKGSAGLLRGLTKGQLEPTLEKAVFGGKRGAVSGPVKTQFGYYVYEIVNIKAASQPTFDESKEQIRSIVTGQKQQKALNDFVAGFTKKWTDKTECRKGFVTQECKNAPKSSTTSTVPPGAIPQQSVTSGANSSAPPGAVPSPSPGN